MLSTPLRRSRAMALAAAAATAVLPLAVTAPALAADSGQALAPGTHFFTPIPDPDGVRQVADLTVHRDLKDAYLVGREETTPQAVWETKGTPAEVQADVHKNVTLAQATHTVPTLVMYNVPGRDCAQYSAGGAQTDSDYQAWADGFARGLVPGRQVVVIVEPDGLGLLPSGCSYDQTPAPTDAGRYADIHYAGSAVLRADPQALVYLDAGHNAWMSVGDAAGRLHSAGVEDFRGFSLNTSNYQWTADLEQYGTWISKCLAIGNYGACPNQYWDGGPATGWAGTALDALQQWRDEPYNGDPATLTWNTVGINTRYDSIMGGATPTTHFVIDTSRNGQGPWDYRAAGFGDDPGKGQDWCNPPHRGLGARPQADPDSAFPLVDADLWVKTPGQSDGQCNRDIPGGTTDPEWGGITDPAAGDWFPQQALELAQLANPPLR